MGTIITILIILAALVLILVVLVQNSKGGGLSSNFASSNQIMGAPKTADFLEKTTWALAGTIIVLSLISTKYIVHVSQQPASQVQYDVPVDNTQSPDMQSPQPGNAASQQGTPTLPQPEAIPAN